jgi:hypothetical protein
MVAGCMERCLWIGKPTALNAMGNFLVGFVGIAAWQHSPRPRFFTTKQELITFTVVEASRLAATAR